MSEPLLKRTICSSFTPVQPIRPAYITAAPCHHDKGAGFFQAVSSSAYQHGLPADEEEDEDDEPDSRDAISGAVCCTLLYICKMFIAQHAHQLMFVRSVGAGLLLMMVETPFILLGVW